MASSRKSLRAPSLWLVLGAVLLLPLVSSAAEEAAPGVTVAPRVEIFTTPSCPYCKVLRTYLKTRGIAYVEHNVSATQETREAFDASGANGVPVVMIGERVIEGFNPVAIEAALKATM